MREEREKNTNMSEKVFIVTSGSYSAYHIDAVFKDKEKAELYCRCHEDCEIEEYEFNDGKIYTSFNAVRVQCEYRNWWMSNRPSVKFVTRSEEDETYMKENKSYVNIYNSYISLVIIRRLSKKYDKDAIIDKYTKVCQDIMSEIKYMLEESGYSQNMDFQQRKELEDNISAAINEKIA